jgi:hypothetical protein
MKRRARRASERGRRKTGCGRERGGIARQEQFALQEKSPRQAQNRSSIVPLGTLRWRAQILCHSVPFRRCTDQLGGVGRKGTIDGNVSPLTNSFQDASRSSLFQPVIVLLFSFVSLKFELLETAASSNYKLLQDPAMFKIEASRTLSISTAVSELRHSHTAAATIRIPNGSHSSPTDCNRA